MTAISTLLKKYKTLNEAIVVLGGVVLLFAASQVQIPIKPIAITLQTVAVMLIGLTYRPRQAVEALLAWIGLGALGFPMFYGFTGGMGVLVGPTAGYIAGFVISVYLMSTLKEKFSLEGWFSDLLLCFMGTVIIYGFGILWLSQLVGFADAIQFGLLPFILPGIVKAGLLCTALKILRQYRKG